MNETYVVEVSVPALGRIMEFLLPSVMKMDAAKMLIVKIIASFHPGFDSEPEKLWLIDLNSRKKLPSGYSCIEAGLDNGSKLLLVSVS